MRKFKQITIQETAKRIIYIVDHRKEFPVPLEDQIIKEIGYYLNLGKGNWARSVRKEKTSNAL